MKRSNLRKLAAAGLLCAVAVVGSMFIGFPVFGSKCAPVQHMVNILCAVCLGPGYGVGVAFCASLLRIVLGSGSVLAFPGSMCGALLCGLVFWRSRNLSATLAAEVLGTGVVGGLAAYPLALVFLPEAAAGVGFAAMWCPSSSPRWPAPPWPAFWWPPCAAPAPWGPWTASRGRPLAEPIKNTPAELSGGRKTVICEFPGTGMISVMPVPLLSAHPRGCSRQSHIRYAPSVCACRWICPGLSHGPPLQAL